LSRDILSKLSPEQRDCLETFRAAFTSDAEAVGLLKKLAVWLGKKKSEAICC